MNIYSFDEIKRAGDCVRFMREKLGADPVSTSGEWTRFNCPWRPGSDGDAFAVKPDGFYDHVEKAGGSILDLCAKASFGGDLWRAQEELGTWLGLKESQKAKKAERSAGASTGLNIVKTYDYTDIDGKLLFQVCRLEPKSFRQRRPIGDDRWAWNLDGVELVPYRLREWAGGEARSVIIVEGEKDADSLAAAGFRATTVPMGAGKWQPSYARWFKGLDVTIWPDNDKVGQEHGQLLLWELREVAASVRIVSAPEPHKDVSDWIAAGATHADLDLALMEADPIKLAALKAPKQDLLSDAKLANERPFSNFTWEAQEGKKDIRVPRLLTAMMEDLFKRFWDFPCRCGNMLFDHDRKNGRIRQIDSPSGLQAWIAEKSGHPVEWGRFEGCVSMEQFFESITFHAKEFQAISGVPSFPTRSDVYYTHDPIPAPSKDGAKLEKLLDFFCPATPLDRALLKVFFATPIWYAPGEDRPLFVVDSRDGKGVGKTKLVGYLAGLYGDRDPALSTPLTVDGRDLKEGQLFDRVIRRMMSGEGRRKRIFLIDNISGFFDSSALASIVTMPVLSGMSPYGRNEENRPNDITFAATVNSATLGTDLISRAIFIELRRPDALMGETRHWEREILGYIRENRLGIIADIMHALERGPRFDFIPASGRFAAWEWSVMAPMVPNLDEYSRLWKLNQERSKSADGDSDEAEAIRERFVREIKALNFNPENQAIWIRANALKHWAMSAIPGFGGRDGRGATHALRNLAKDGCFPELSAYPQTYPHNGPGQHRGMFWRKDLAESADWSGDVVEVYLEGDKVEWRSL